MGLRGGCIAVSHFTQNLPSDLFANISAFGGNKKSSFNISTTLYSCHYKVSFDSIERVFCFFDSCPLSVLNSTTVEMMCGIVRRRLPCCHYSTVVWSCFCHTWTQHREEVESVKLFFSSDDRSSFQSCAFFKKNFFFVDEALYKAQYSLGNFTAYCASCLNPLNGSSCNSALNDILLFFRLYCKTL